MPPNLGPPPCSWIVSSEPTSSPQTAGAVARASPRASRSTDESPSAQIDVVGLRDDNWTDLGECRWGRVRSGPALEAELDRKARLDPNRRGATLGRRYFARRKPASRADANNWYSLQDLYALP